MVYSFMNILQYGLINKILCCCRSYIMVKIFKIFDMNEIECFSEGVFCCSFYLA